MWTALANRYDMIHFHTRWAVIVNLLYQLHISVSGCLTTLASMISCPGIVCYCSVMLIPSIVFLYTTAYLSALVTTVLISFVVSLAANSTAYLTLVGRVGTASSGMRSQPLFVLVLFPTLYTTNHNLGWPGRARTCDILINSQTLLPTELLANNLVGVGGFEPPTSCSQSRRYCQTELNPV